MAGENSTQLQCLKQTEGIGQKLVLKEERLEAAAVLIRALAAFAEADDTQVLIDEGEAYEQLIKRLSHLQRNLCDMGSLAHQLLSECDAQSGP